MMPGLGVPGTSTAGMFFNNAWESVNKLHDSLQVGPPPETATRQITGNRAEVPLAQVPAETTTPAPSPALSVQTAPPLSTPSGQPPVPAPATSPTPNEGSNILYELEVKQNKTDKSLLDVTVPLFRSKKFK